MTDFELKPNMRVKTRNGGMYAVFLDTNEGIVFVRKEGWIQGQIVRGRDDEWGVVAVYAPPMVNGLLCPDAHGVLLWSENTEAVEKAKAALTAAKDKLDIARVEVLKAEAAYYKLKEQ